MRMTKNQTVGIKYREFGDGGEGGILSAIDGKGLR